MPKSPIRCRRAAVLAVAGAALTVLAGPLAAPGQAHVSPRATTNPAQQYAADAVAATNEARTSGDLKRVAVNGCLRDFAIAQAKRMASTSSTYSQNLSPVMRECDLDYAAENVAWGFPTGKSVVTQGWMRTAGHRANLMNKQFTKIGIAARKDSRGYWYVSAVLGG